jgi:hypothetical protein
VAFQVPLPSGSDFTFDISFSSGRHPVCPALTIFKCLTTSAELATEAQPVRPKKIADKGLIRDINFISDIPIELRIIALTVKNFDTMPTIQKRPRFMRWRSAIPPAHFIDPQNICITSMWSIFREEHERPIDVVFPYLNGSRPHVVVRRNRAVDCEVSPLIGSIRNSGTALVCRCIGR